MRAARAASSAAVLAALLIAAVGWADRAVRDPATIARVIDGDTVQVIVHGRFDTVRVIGLDTPETKDPRRPVECFGREASARAEALLLIGADVDLEPDPTQANRDKYRRLLRHIRLPDGRLFAKVMIAEGYGFEYTYAVPYRYQEDFKAAQREATEAERGLWAEGACDAPWPVSPTPLPDMIGSWPCEPGQTKGNRNSGIYHPPGGSYYARTYANVQCFDTEAEAAAAGFWRPRR